MSFFNGNEAGTDETTAQGEPKRHLFAHSASARVRDPGDRRIGSRLPAAFVRVSEVYTTPYHLTRQ